MIFQPIYSIILPKGRFLPDAEDFSFHDGQFHRIWRTAGLGGLPEKRHTSGAVFHDHNYSEIAVIISVPARHVLDGENVPVAAGDVLIIHPGAVHAYDETAEMEIIHLIFDPSRLSLPQLYGYSLPLFGKIFPDGKNLYHSANPAARLVPDDLAETVRMIRKL